MGPDMNVFRVLGDLSHTASKCILIWAIHNNRSSEGVSLLTQLLYMLVFVTRYLDLFWVPPWWSKWNFFFKIFFLSTSAYIIFLMMRVFARTKEKEYGRKLAIWSLAGCLVSAPFVCWLFEGWESTTFAEVVWTFSEMLESVCILPQLLLLRQTSVPTVLDSFYLATLGAYRFFYILNWIIQAAGGGRISLTSVVFGVLQTAFYADFAWVYYSRQRVKLRGGGIVDSDDLSKSFLVRRFISARGGTGAANNDDDIADEDATLAGQESGTIRPGRNWGPRGISVSADDTLEEHQAGSGDAQMVDPSHFEDIEDDAEDEADAPPPPVKDTAPKPHSQSDGTADHTADAAGSSASEWQDNDGTSK